MRKSALDGLGIRYGSPAGQADSLRQPGMCVLRIRDGSPVGRRNGFVTAARRAARIRYGSPECPQRYGSPGRAGGPGGRALKTKLAIANLKT